MSSKKTKIKKLLAHVGIRNAYDAERHRKYTVLKTQLDGLVKASDATTCSIIIFSKDRAIQLDALLRSYYHFAENALPVHVLYHAAQPAYQKSYNELKAIYADQDIQFIEEQVFKKDLIGLFAELSCAKVLFMVDDLIFKRKIDMMDFTAIDTDRFVPSLRLGKHLDYAYTLERAQILPSFDDMPLALGMHSWSWAKGDGDWEYPLSVDGHLFDKEEMRILIEGLEYKAPNSLEEAMQLMKPYFMHRKGLCFTESVILNNPCNKVQTENDNVSGEISIKQLNQQWEQGFRIYFEEFEGMINQSAHQELSYTFVKR